MSSPEPYDKHTAIADDQDNVLYTVKVRDAADRPVTNTEVKWSVDNGQLVDEQVRTGGQGEATVRLISRKAVVTEDFYSDAKQICQSLGSQIAFRYSLERFYEEWGNFYLYDGWMREFYVTSTDYLAASSGSAEHLAKWAS
ncbi:intimin EaeA [Xenorhabdus beddingii]|uniref:Intimin EaeA n=1 Tax=Xenorhabdus beddingii TaxID=40578 RepID=A0A1Y2SML3_9GAMM|nr:Ig-like domain-containing protein [Xenorhabdus beddingii]OTA19828.1 intimin EaeA [Xenorhabdus beddingii]